MKICVISEMEYGSGASIAALRLAAALSRDGHEVHYLFQYPFEDFECDEVIAHRLCLSQQSATGSFLHATLPLVGETDYIRARAHLSRCGASLPKWAFWHYPFRAKRLIEFGCHYHRAAGRIRRALESIQPDVVNLHNVGAVLRHSDILTIARRYSVVWTMHDNFALNLYNLRYTVPDGSGEIVYGKLVNSGGQARYLEKMLEADLPITFITPSEWLREENLEGVAGRKEIKVIPNGFSKDMFFEEDQQESRRELNLDSEAFYVLFIATVLSNKLKNFPTLAEAVRLAGNPNLRIMAVGEATDEFRSEYPFVDVFDHTIEQRRLRQFYSAADAIAVPSVIENLPNVAVESLFCGRPVLGAKVGGIPEIVDPGKTGWLFDPYRPGELADLLGRLLHERKHLLSMRPNCLAIAHRLFGIEQQSDAYQRLFKQFQRSAKT